MSHPLITHELKILDGFFTNVWTGLKQFEVRKNDRDFEENDIVLLREYIPEEKRYTGAEILIKITYLLDDFPGIEDGYCVFGFEILHKKDKE